MKYQTVFQDATQLSRRSVRPNPPGSPADQPRISAAARQLYDSIAADFEGAQSIRAVLSNALAVARERHKARPVRRTEIALRCRLVNDYERRYGKVRYVLDDAALAERIATIVQFHEGLWALNFKMRVVDYFKPRHAVALLEEWKATLSRGRIEQRWTVLRWWVDRALEKPGVVPPLEVLWPPSPSSIKASPLGPVNEPPQRARPVRDASEVRRVIDALMAIDERAGWMLRLKVDLGLTIPEAARVDPVVATAYETVFMTLEERGRTGRTIVLDTDDKRAMVAALRDWGKRRARGCLGWPDLDQDQISDKLVYLQRRARAEVAARDREAGGRAEPAQDCGEPDSAAGAA